MQRLMVLRVQNAILARKPSVTAKSEVETKDSSKSSPNVEKYVFQYKTSFLETIILLYTKILSRKSPFVS